MRISASVLAMIIVGVIAYSLLPSGGNDAIAEEGAPIVKIEIPGQFSKIAMLGKQAFDIKCARLVMVKTRLARMEWHRRWYIKSMNRTITATRAFSVL